MMPAGRGGHEGSRRAWLAGQRRLGAGGEAACWAEQVQLEASGCRCLPTYALAGFWG